jgi:beta-mannosidase
LTESTHTIELDGRWQLVHWSEAPASGALDRPDLAWMPATVPGAVHGDLVAAGRLENPLASRRAAADAAWVADSDWLYRRTFTLQEAPSARCCPELLFESIDTYADIWLNGVLVGASSNMFRPCRLRLAPHLLRTGENTLLVHVKAHQRMLADLIPDSERIAAGPGSTAHRDRSLIRRYQRSYNTSLLNLGETVLGIGIPGSASLSLYPEAHIADVCLVTERLDMDAADVRLLAQAEGHVAGAELELALYIEGAAEPVARAVAPAIVGEVACNVRVSRPRLWWPAGYGQPHLYRLEARLLRQGSVLHSLARWVGIKTVSLVRTLPNGRETFQLQVNGRDIYVRGGNMMPIDAIRGLTTATAYERMLQLTLNANMNLIRLWGGGLPESEAFLDRCDALGIMVWQDFLYHSSTYPDYDAGFMAEAEAEAADLVAKMRPHACLAVLCGGNEQQQGWDEWNWQQEMDRFYGERLFTELLPRVCAERAPEIPYVPNSPHGGLGGQSPTTGDTHTWGNYYNATKDPLFVTETCWIYDSYSRPETLRETMGLHVNELAARGWPRRWRELTGLGLFTKFPFTHYDEITSLRAYLRSLEVEQLEADYQALVYLRTRSPSCNGLVYWPLNKGGPLFGFGCIDYAGRPLMAYYAVQRVFADVVLHLYRDGADVRVVAANAAEPLAGILRIWHVHANGRISGRWELPTTIASGNCVRLFDLVGLDDEVIDRTREWLYAEFAVGGAAVAQAQLLFCPLAELRVEPGEVTVRAQRLAPDRWRLDLTTTRPTPLLEIEADGRVIYSDDYFALIPGVSRSVWATLLQDLPPTGLSVTITAWDRSAQATVSLA